MGEEIASSEARKLKKIKLNLPIEIDLEEINKIVKLKIQDEILEKAVSWYLEDAIKKVVEKNFKDCLLTMVQEEFKSIEKIKDKITKELEKKIKNQLNFLLKSQEIKLKDSNSYREGKVVRIEVTGSSTNKGTQS